MVKLCKGFSVIEKQLQLTQISIRTEFLKSYHASIEPSKVGHLERIYIWASQSIYETRSLTVTHTTWSIVRRGIQKS
jgi:hypothetical protein